MKIIKTEDAVGEMLCHDVTQIIPGKSKGEPLKRGHIITEEDIPLLLSIGKENLFVWDPDMALVHENDAAAFLYELVSDENMEASEVSAGRINSFAKVDGILRINKEKLYELNSVQDVCVSARHDYSIVRKGDMLFGTRVTPLMVEQSIMDEASKVASGEQIARIVPFQPKKVGIVTTGSEVFKGLIEDGFGPVLRSKLNDYCVEEMGQIIVPDDHTQTTASIKAFIDQGADIILATGGMSVDPDDKTPLAIKNTGAEIITYGTPIFPGAMLMLAYLGDVTILGIPGGALHSKRTAFDILLPRALAGIKTTKEDIIRLGNGGLCLNCKACIYPNCGFGVE